MTRRSLILDAAEAAADARAAVEADEFAPLDPYAAAEKLGASVRFVDVNMEGFYVKGPPARILISAQRPLARRTYTCGHELGHHWFGHGTTLDQLQASDRQGSQDPHEVVAEAFGAFLLMPTIGVRSAFARRGWSPRQSTPLQILTVASEFGVGYTTLVTHLALTMHDIAESTRASLVKWTPQKIRKAAIGLEDAAACLFLDAHSSANSYDLETGDAIAVSMECECDISGGCLQREREVGGYRLFRAVKRGCAALSLSTCNADIRVAPHGYVGRAVFRHMEDTDDA